MLGLALERATGVRLAALVSAELWAPMGAEEDACFTVDPTGFACACGGLNATLRDLTRFGQLYVMGGAAANRQIVPEEWIRQTALATRTFFHGAYQGAAHGAYRNRFWLEDGGGYCSREVYSAN